MKHPLHVNPQAKDYREYFDHILAYNEILHREVAKLVLDEFQGSEDGFCIATVGSDARYEKGPGSLVEVILLSSKSVKRGIRRRLELLVTDENRGIFDPRIERKSVDEDSMVESVIGEAETQIRLISPNRILDVNSLFGDQKMHQKAKLKLAEELKSGQGRSIYDRIKDKVRHHKVVTLNGTQRYKQEYFQHFDLDDGVAFYDPEKGLWSFKQGPLRYVQFTIVRDVSAAIRESEKGKRALYLPQNTVSKLNSIEVDGAINISQEQMSDLTDSYKFFLHQYHLSQWNHRQGLTITAFDPKEVKERCKSLTEICPSRLFSYEQNQTIGKKAS
ncbi:hypothetical protein HYU09_02815 [Candidatus Woesearchaeota archaeon]|nr:hypothetical protein [Candidatus Woesearchaeota archaeon]